MPSAPGRSRTLRSRDAKRHTVQPRRNRIATTDRSRANRKHQEGRLKGVLDLIPIAEHSATNPQHHEAVPSQECSECELGGFMLLASA